MSARPRTGLDRAPIWARRGLMIASPLLLVGGTRRRVRSRSHPSHPPGWPTNRERRRSAPIAGAAPACSQPPNHREHRGDGEHAREPPRSGARGLGAVSATRSGRPRRAAPWRDARGRAAVRRRLHALPGRPPARLGAGRDQAHVHAGVRALPAFAARGALAAAERAPDRRRDLPRRQRESCRGLDPSLRSYSQSRIGRKPARSCLRSRSAMASGWSPRWRRDSWCEGCGCSHSRSRSCCRCWR